MPLTSDQKRTVAKLAPRVLADFYPDRAPDVNVERALTYAVERGRVGVTVEGRIRWVEFFTLGGNVEGVRVFGANPAGAALVKYYRFLAS